MKPDRFQLVSDLFNRLRREPVEARSALLDDLCREDPDVREEVEALLQVHDHDSGTFLGGPALSGVELGASRGSRRQLPERIGRYQLMDEIGEGGMGVVYRAEQETTRQVVALKLLRTDIASPRMMRRFEVETQALGRLRHPGIARIYEAGVDAGIPYIAMEYIAGATLREYLQRERPDRAHRLRLFVRICDAVHHAHLNAVIHRDLKPGNILVDAAESGLDDGVPIPKILDFGIARVTDSDVKATTLETRVGQLIGTVQYMSPEQASGRVDELDARSDVYALGIIGYEMLTGRLPFDFNDVMLHDAVRMIREDDPISLDSVSRDYRGDLNTILAKAMEKTRERRYQSARELAADVQRFLGDQPIVAHPPSTLYQVGKFARRNRVLVVCAALIVIVLGAAAAVGTGFALSEARQRRLAEDRYRDLHDLASSFILDFDGELEHLTGALPARRAIVERGIEHLGRLMAQGGDDPELQRHLAIAYMRVGDVQGDPQTSNLGDTDGAMISYETARRLFEDRAVTNLADTAGHLYMVNGKLADLHKARNEVDEARGYYEASLRWAREARDADNERASRWVSVACDRLADMLRTLGRVDEAMTLRAEATEILNAMAAARPFDRDVHRDLAVRHFKSGLTALGEGRTDEALVSLDTYLETIREIAEADPTNDIFQADLSIGYERRGEVLEAMGRIDDAIAMYEEAVRVGTRLSTADPHDVGALHALCAPYCNLGEIYLARGELATARPWFEQFFATANSIVDRSPNVAASQRELGVAIYKMYEWHAAAATAGSPGDHLIDARRWLTQCLERFRIMEQNGLLSPGDAGVIADLTAEIETLDARIADMPESRHQHSTR